MDVNGGIRQVEECGGTDESVQERIETGAPPLWDQAWSREHNGTRHVVQRWLGHPRSMIAKAGPTDLQIYWSCRAVSTGAVVVQRTETHSGRA
jgi:hypothetical protein